MRAHSAGFEAAIRDYRWLLDSGYPETASLSLVGNRYELPREERDALFRGLSSAADSARRASVLHKYAPDAKGRLLLVDGYNQLFLVMHYLAGKDVFLASDGCLRDSGAAHGRVASAGLFARAAGILAAAAAELAPATIRLYLDAPVPRSAEHAALVREGFAAAGVGATGVGAARWSGPEGAAGLEGAAGPEPAFAVELARSADAPLRAAPPGAAVATGDSAILDALAARGEGRFAVDLARFALESAFGERGWFDFGALPLFTSP